MKLSNRAIEHLQNRRVMLELAISLGFSEQWMRKVIEANKDNGPLTTAISIQVINKETGLSQEDILEESASEEVGATK